MIHFITSPSRALVFLVSDGQGTEEAVTLYLCLSFPRTGLWQFNMPACDFCSWKKMGPYKMYLCFFLTDYVFRLVMWLWVAENFSRVTQTAQGWWKSWNAGEKPWGRIPRGVTIVLRVQCLPPEMWAYIWVLSLPTSPTALRKLLRGQGSVLGIRLVSEKAWLGDEGAEHRW